MRILAAAALFALTACATTPGARQPSSTGPAKMGGSWRGTYFYPDYLRQDIPAPVEFQFELADTERGFSGRSREPNTFGDKSAAELTADVTGYVLPGGQFHFYKKMDGTGGVGHTIEYDGQLGADGRSAEGHWFIPGAWSGKFRMERRQDQLPVNP